MTIATLYQSPRWKLLSARLALGLLVALGFVLLTGLVDGGIGVAPRRMFDQPLFLLANALPGLLFASLLLVITRRLLLSFGLAFLLQTVVYGVNALKVGDLGTPLMPADFRMIGQLSKGGAHLLGGYLPHSPWPYLALLGGVLAIIAMWRYEPVLFQRRTRGKRIVASGLLATLLVSLLAGASPWDRVYSGQHLWLEPWSASSTATHSGLVSSLLLYKLQYAHARKKIDPAAAIGLIGQSEPALQQRMQATPDSHNEAPDIVVIQSESFFDPTIVKGYEHSDLTPNLRRLAAGGNSGALHVPTYGGGTIRTEFEMLTGLSLRYFDDMQFPYLQMGSKVMPGLVRTLRAHGYATVAVHGNNPSFWNRTAAFKALGFDRFVSQSSFPPNAPMDGTYMADSAMTDEIMTQLKDVGPPQFLFAISIEAHGPYDVSPGIDTTVRDAIPVPAGVNGEAKLAVQNYLYHMQHADAELGRLAKLLQQRSRPTLLLFYGDHLPALTDAYNVTGFVNGQDMLDQPGTWLLIDPRNPGQPEHEDLASWMLPGKLLEHAGIHDDAYFSLTQVLAPQLATLTHAPGAPQVPDEITQKRTDDAMASVALLRMKGKLDGLFPRAAVQNGVLANDEHAPPANITRGVQQ